MGKGNGWDAWMGLWIERKEEEEEMERGMTIEHGRRRRRSPEGMKERDEM